MLELQGIGRLYGPKFDDWDFAMMVEQQPATGPWSMHHSASPEVKQRSSGEIKTRSLRIYLFNFRFRKGSISAKHFAGSIPRRSVWKCICVWFGAAGCTFGRITTTGNTAGFAWQINLLANIPPADGSDFYFFVITKECTQSQLFVLISGRTAAWGSAMVARAQVRWKWYSPGHLRKLRWLCSLLQHQDYHRRTEASCNSAAIKIEMNFPGQLLACSSINRGSR